MTHYLHFVSDRTNFNKYLPADRFDINYTTNINTSNMPPRNEDLP